MIPLKQSTAYTILTPPFLDNTDGDTEEDLLTIAYTDVLLSKNFGTPTPKNETTPASHVSNGRYAVPINTTDTGTIGILNLFIHVSGALYVEMNFEILPANVYDSRFGTDYLQVDTVQVSGTAQTANDNGADINDIKVVTDNIPDSGAMTSIANESTLIVTGAVVDSIKIDTGTNIPADIAALNDLSASDVNAEMVDVLSVDTYAEPGQGTPPATASVAAKIGYLYKSFRNKKSNNGTEERLYNDAGDTVDQKATVSDDGTTATKGAYVSGA